MILNILLEDQGQDFTYINVSTDGVMSGNSVLFADRRLSLIGIGSLGGKIYYTLDELKKGKFKQSDNLYIYYKNSNEKTPLPWNANVFKYKVTQTKVNQ